MIQLKHITTFVLQAKCKGDRYEHLICRIKFNGSKSIVAVSVGFTVEREGWNTKAQRCNPRTFHGRKKIPAATINKEIERFVAETDALFESYAAADMWPTPERVRTDIRVALGLDAPKYRGIEAAWREFCLDEAVRRAWTPATHAKYDVLWNRLTEWRDDTTWDDMDNIGLGRWVDYLQNDRGFQNSSIKKLLGYLRTFLRWSFMQGYLKTNDFERFRPVLKTADNRPIYLTWEELMKVYNWETKDTFRSQVRDLFCFSAFTSLRYSDTQNLCWPDVGPDTISVITVKTCDPLVIDLNRYSRAILDKYRDKEYPGFKVLPTISNQVCNKVLKKIMEEIGINAPVRHTYYKGSQRIDEVKPKWEFIGTHAGRRTFISNAIIMGIAPDIVMKWTGHKDYDAMRPYIAIADEVKRTAMSAFDRM